MEGCDLSSASSNYPSATLLLTLFLLFPWASPVTAQGDNSASPSAAMSSPEKPKKTKITWIFDGNEALTTRQLNKVAETELHAFSKDSATTHVDDSAFLMKMAYRKIGHHFARVDYEIVATGDETLVTFKINEGPAVRITEMQISGNTAFGREELLEYFYARDSLSRGEALFIESQLKSFAGQIGNLYIGAGYADAEIFSPDFIFTGDRSRVTVSISINEGPLYTIHDIVLSGDIPEAAQGVLTEVESLLLGLPYYHRRQLLLKSTLSEEISNLGYPEVTVDVSTHKDKMTGHVTLTAAVNPGTRVTIGDVGVQGNERTQSHFIKSRLELGEGDLYSQTGKRESFNQLYQTGLFSRVKLHLAEDNKGAERTLMVEVDERPARDFHVETGWGAYEMLRFKGGYTDRNLFGVGRIFRTEGTASFMGRYGLLGLTDPWLLDGSVTGDASLFYRFREEPSFTMEEAGATLLFSKKLSRSITSSLEYSYSSKDITELDSEMGPMTDDQDYTLGLCKLQFTGDTRNDVFFPTSGYRWHSSFELADTLFGGTLEFYRLSWGFRYFYPLSKTVTLGTRYRSGIILPSAEESTVPIGERFFNGGESSVRGFRESQLGPRDADDNPYGGTAYNLFNIELRKKIRQNLSANLFFDLGNVSPNKTLEDGSSSLTMGRSALIDATFADYLRDMRASYGIGVQYLTPIGPARLDFAHNPKPQGDDGSFLIHFSVGMAF